MLQWRFYCFGWTDTLINAAGQWFLQSGILEAGGGVARYYRSDLGQNAAISTEITGYAVSALLFLHERTGEQAYLEAGLRAARFLTRQAWDEKLRIFPFEHLNGDGGPSFAYFFDCGIIARALLQVWRKTQEVEFLDAAAAAGRAMRSDFTGSTGKQPAIHPILELPGKRPLAWGPRWSARPGCYQLKSALAWRELFEITAEPAFLRAYESLLKSALADDPEFLPGHNDPRHVMDRLHAYAYFLEGLLPVLDRAECASAFRRGLERISGYLHDIAPLFARSDVYAQVLRLRLLGEERGVTPLDRPLAAHEAERAASFQIESADQRQAGGFLFGRQEGQAMPFVNPVSTAFCAQALALWQDREAGRPLISHEALI